MTINTGTAITSPSYDTILTTVTSVISDFYGSAVSSSLVTSGTSYIQATDWNNLYSDINRGLIHQTGSGLPFGTISTGSVLTSRFVNSLTNYSTQIYTNKANAPASSQLTTATPVSATRTSNWGSGLTLRVQYSWQNAASAAAFFNLGGYLLPSIALPTPSVINAIDSDWKDFINFVAADLATNTVPYNAAAYNGSAPSYTQTRNITPQGPSSISISYTKVNAYTVVASIVFYPEGNSLSIGSLPSASVTEHYSTAANGGIAATRPAVQILETLDLGGQTVYPILSFTPVSTPSIHQYNTGTINITLSNGGTGAAHISGVVFHPAPGSTITQQSLSITTSTIGASGSAVITLVVDVGTEAKDTTVDGSYITITSDNANGVVTVPIQIGIIYPIFRVTIAPAAVSTTLTVSDPVTQFFNFSSGLTGAVASVTASISNTTNFTLNVSQPFHFGGSGGGFLSVGIPAFDYPGGISLTFTPPGRYSNTDITGTHATTLTVTYNPVDTSQAPVTYTIPITYTLDIQNANLGTWISGRDQKNSVAGLSYDIIGGHRYVTIGFGMGGDDSKVLSAGGSVYASIKNLLPSADPNPALGIPLYASTDASFGAFLNEYGSWITINGGNKYGTAQDITYTFSSSGGNASFEFSAADSGDLYINGTRYTSWSDQLNSTRGTVTLASGDNTVRIVVATASSRPAAFGVNITDGNGTSIWSTKTPRRTAYYGWAEVYRIPIAENTANVYLNGSYPIKLTDYCNGFTYSHWCGTDKNLGSMFVVISDPHNNITLSMNPIAAASPTGITDLDLTLALSIAVPYYYSNILARYTNIAPAIDSRYTNFFLGFTRDGTIRKSKVPFPYLITIIGADGKKRSLIANLTLGLEIAAVTFGAVAVGLGVYSVVAGVAVAETGLATAIAGTTVGDTLIAAATYIAEALSTCFTKGTLVSMADDTVKPIEDVKIGEKVYNKDRTRINEVTYIEVDKDLNFGHLYSPATSHQPFATVNHPLYIGGELTCVDPERNYAIYPWLGKNNKFDTDYIIPANGQNVYNLWVDGDNTYIVNGYGTHTIIGDGGWARKLIEQGIMEESRLTELLTEYTSESKEAAYGIYLCNNLLGLLDIKIVNKVLGKIMVSKDNTLTRKAIKYTIKTIGKISCFITRK